MFGNIYKGKRVAVTGHTGFKGFWLSSWLLELGAEVFGASVDIPTQPAAFEVTGLEKKISHRFLDVRNFEALSGFLTEVRPDFVFHLAAQPIVSVSYRDPLKTIETNVMGTAHVLESLRLLKNPCVGVIITSDKCYENVEWPWGYRETDQLGGKDVYSGSKGAAEVVFHAYQKSFFADPNGNVRLATARAGNVIGGGDWAKDRIVADAVRSWSQNKPVGIRSPNATRPWQHVLEPLSGYLALAANLSQSIAHHGQSYNFGPRDSQNQTVAQLLGDLGSKWGFKSLEECYTILEKNPHAEAGLLKLNCDKALFDLKWLPTLNYAQTIDFISSWYREFYLGKVGTDMFDLTIGQIESYQRLASEQSLHWTK